MNKLIAVVTCVMVLLTGQPQTEEVITWDESETSTEIYMIVEEPKMDWVSLGTVTLTAYCPCEKCCGEFSNGITSTGVTAQSRHTIAVDPKVIPYGTEVLIGNTVYYAEDCGGAIKGNRIDVYHDTHQEALEFGRQKMEVFIWKEVQQ